MSLSVQRLIGYDSEIGPEPYAIHSSGFLCGPCRRHSASVIAENSRSLGRICGWNGVGSWWTLEQTIECLDPAPGVYKDPDIRLGCLLTRHQGNPPQQL